MNWHVVYSLVFDMKAEFVTRLDDCADELQKIKKRIDKNQFDDMVMFLQRYAIIKACGTVESVIKNMIADHVDANTNPEIQHYIATNVRDSSKVKQHGTEKTSLNSLVQLRNDFAHGLSPNTTINTIIRYFNDSRVIVTLVDETLNGI